MTLPTFVTIDGFQYRGTTAFARGWVDANGDPIAQTPSVAFPPSEAGAALDTLIAALAGATADRDITADVDTSALEAALAGLGREKMTYVAPLAAPAGNFADLAAATTYATNLNAKVTAVLAALVAKGYMASS